MIGIGAGPATDGQVLVFHDLLGIRDGLGPRFVKRYANLQEEMNAGVAAYAEDVRARRYPAPEHTYKIDPAELAELRRAAGLRPPTAVGAFGCSALGRCPGPTPTGSVPACS